MRDFSLKSPIDEMLVRSRPLFEEGVSALSKFDLARRLSRRTMFVLGIDGGVHNCKVGYRARVCDIRQLSRQPVAAHGGSMQTSCASWVTASRPQMHRCRSGQRRQNKEQKAGLAGHHCNNDESHAVPTGRSFDGKGDANDEERSRQDRLKQKKEFASFTL
jgi:hypothetical protein